MFSNRYFATVNVINGLQHVPFCTTTTKFHPMLSSALSFSFSSLAGGSFDGASTLNNGHHHHRHGLKYISNFLSSPSLRKLSSKHDSDGIYLDVNNSNNNGTATASTDVNDSYNSKKAIIDKWMRWNTASTFRYTPNSNLLSQISLDGSTSSSPLNAFRDLVPKVKREAEPVGRSWSVKELRRKSYDDLHKLWYVLYKERNMLLTETNLARRHGYEMVQPERKRKVQKSMGAIKHVLGERKRKKIGEYREYLREVEGLKQEMTKKTNYMTNTVLPSDDSSIEDGMEKDAQNLSLSEKA